MKLREYQAKSLFSEHGLAVPRGHIAHTPAEVVAIVRKLGRPVVLKPQLGVKGRGKVGGIAFADDAQIAEREAERLLAMEIKGERVQTLLVEEKLAIAKELYLAVTIDYAARQPVIMASTQGGVDIEEVAATTPERIFKIPVNILTGVIFSELDPIAAALGEDVLPILKTLYELFRKYDAELIEINPLIRTSEGELFAADAVLNVNDDSLFRQEELLNFKKDIPVEDPLAEEASQKSWTYIDLEGDIGILSSGAGLTMAILDLIHKEGGRAANFLDTAQIDDEGIYDAFELLSRAKKVKVLLLNMFAGLNRCDRLAEGIRRYLQEHPTQTPIVVRMIGNLEQEGHKILKELGIEPFTQLEHAVLKAVTLSKEA
ncbi:succinate--CoA ligase subunit beta [candidate division CSSED10-310 bacterium]|uniref:Succinate--CoA ligase subunit beta n=1 Tax=candidate division CSSED10-310 bacterium TaxID=2855610 RepID=A0ABV6Z258_UNCC1